jgi:hypothetical protein
MAWVAARLSRCGTDGAERARAEFEHGKNRVKDFAMQIARPVFALDPKRFGRGRTYEMPTSPTAAAIALSDDVKLFAGTFLAGFVFVSILIG